MDLNSAPAQAKTQEPAYTHELATLRNRINDPKATGFDLVWLAMICMYISTEQSLRISVDKMSEKLERMDKLRKIQRYFTDQATAGQSRTADTIASSVGEDFTTFSEKDIPAGGEGEDADSKPIGKEIDLGDGYIFKIYWADDTSTFDFNELTGEVTGTSDTEGGTAPTATFGQGATFRAVLEQDGVATKEIISYKDIDGQYHTKTFDLTDVTDQYDGQDFGDNNIGFWEPNTAGGATPNGRNVSDGPPRFIAGEKIYQRSEVTSSGMHNDNEDFGFKLDNGVMLEFNLTDGQIKGFSCTQDGESVGRDVSWTADSLTSKIYQDASKEKSSAEIDEKYESNYDFYGKDYVEYDLYDTDNSKTNILARDGKTVIGSEVDLGDGYKMRYYFADDPDTKDFNEATGTVYGDDSALRFGPEDGQSGAVFRSVLVNKNNEDIKEFISYKSTNNEMKTVVYDLTIAKDTKWQTVNSDQITNSASKTEPTYYVNNENVVYKRESNTSYGPSSSFDIELENKVVQHFTLNDKGIITKIESSKNDEKLNTVNFDPASYDGTEGPVLVPYSEINDVTADIKNDGSLALQTFNHEDQTDQSTSYEEQVLASEKKLLDLGIVDENGDGILHDDLLIFMKSSLGYDFKVGHVFTAQDFTSLSKASEDEIASLNSLNQIDMLYLEKTFNMMNTIVTSLSNIESSHNRAALTIANNMG